jgi:hypothetical protein
MKIVLFKNLSLKKSLLKHSDIQEGIKLDYFKKQILDCLDDAVDLDEKEGVKKAGYPVGTIRTWKGQEFVKIAPGKWMPKYNSQTRGARMAIGAIKRKVDAAHTAKELMDIVLLNRDRFSDQEGHPLPFVQELSKYVAERQEYLPENIKAKRKEARSNAIKSGQKKAREKKEAAKKAGEENKRKKAEEMKAQEKQNADEPKGNEPANSGDSQDDVDFQSIKDKYQGGKNVEGNEDEIYVGDEALQGKWKLVEADSPSASHDEESFHKTRGFPKNKDGSTINDRDYAKDKAAQETVMSMAANFDGRALSFDSPVVVTQDGIVVSGNNRTMSSKLAARKGSDTRYIDALRKRAERFGFKAGDIDGFKHPRVVFEIDGGGEYSTRDFAKYNQESQKTMSPLESAVKVSKIITEETVKAIAVHISEFETMGELYADKKACTTIFNSLQTGKIINEFSRNTYIDPDGFITGAGKEFLETVLIGSVVNEQNIRALNREGCKHIRAKLVRAITPLVNNKSLGGYSIMDELNQAIDISVQFNIGKDKFGTLDDLVKQGSMFEKMSSVAVELARKLQMNQKDFAEFMQSMNASLEVGSSGQPDIFLGEVETKDDVLSRILSIKKAIRNVLNFFKKANFNENEHPRDGDGKFTEKGDTVKMEDNGGGKRISDWLSPENLSEAKGKTRSEIFTQFGNEYEPIASVHPEYLKYLGDDISDTAVYSGKGYFIDHAVNHHPEVAITEYMKIPDILSNPDDVKLDDRNPDRASLVFVKKFENYGRVIVSVDTNDMGKIVIHKTFFYSKKSPYTQLRSIRA